MQLADTTGEDCGGTSFTTASDFGPRPLFIGVGAENLKLENNCFSFVLFVFV